MSRVTLYTETESEDRFDFSVKQQAGKVCRAVLKDRKFPYNAEISLLLVDNEAIRILNRDHRGIDRVTDVLSFPNLSYEEPAGFEKAVSEQADCIDPDNGYVVLGDIVLNTARVKEQAAEYGHSELREFSFLIAHSMLHLCGYDHMEEEEAKVMEALQEKILNDMGITRD